MTYNVLSKTSNHTVRHYYYHTYKTFSWAEFDNFLQLILYKHCQ